MDVSLHLFIYIVFSVTSTFCVFGQERQEPVCSRFHYDEMLLEKMIRLEHSTNLMMEEFRSIQVKVDNDLATVRKATEDMKSSFQQELDNQRKASEEMKEMIQNETQANKDVMKNIEAGVQRSSYAFSVYWLADTSLSTGEVVVFSKKLLDEGELYDTRTGKYTVPVSGKYYFTAALCTGSGNDYGSVNIVADGVRIGAFDLGDGSFHRCSSGNGVAKLQKNANIWLVVTNSFTGRNSDDYYGFNYFAGYLINEEQ